MNRFRTYRRYAAVAVMMTSALAVAACTGKGVSGTPTPTPSAAASLTPSVDASVAVASAQILAAYRGYQAAYQSAAAAPNPDDTALLKYIGDPLLTQVRQDLRLLKTNGLVRQGTPKINATVTRVQLTTTPPVAMIQDCYDVSDVHVINKATGKSADAPGQATRYLVTSQAKFFGGSTGWLIVQSDADRNNKC